mgnify:CR=1 FL=1|jgi:ABC-2 type transport system ATP-binding protein
MGAIAMNKIEAVNLSKKYPTFQLKNVSFEVPKGYVTGFIGKNGAGKTTTIKAILSMIDYNGAILIDGKNTKETNYHQEVGVVMDDSFLAKDWTIKNVNQAMEIGYENWNENTFFQYLQNFDIDCSLKVKELSRGMKIKLMLSIALSHSANLLILDEPTSGLDPSMRDEFTGLISNFMRDENNTVLFSTHITQDLEAIADYIVFIDKGEIVLSKEKDEFKNYFMILKGDAENCEKIDETAILGKKGGPHNCELLIKREALSSVPDGFAEDIVTIDRIIVLYERMA